MKILKRTVIGLVVLALVGVGGFFYLGMSSQNGSAPGLTDGRLAACPSSPNCVSSEQGTQSDKAVASLPLDAWDLLPVAIIKAGGSVTREDEDYIAAEFRSSIFGFVDDLELRRAEDAVHVRSASRVGYSDAGVNAERVADLRNLLTE